MNISFVIPCLDEPYLPILQEKIVDMCLNSAYIDEWEFIVRDDKGCGNAILRGIHMAKHDVICVMDADGSHNPTYIPFMIQKMDEYDIVYGVKNVNKDSAFRKFVTFSFDFMARILVMDIPDLMSGFFMFRKSMVGELPVFIDHPKVLMYIVKNNKHLKVDNVKITFEKRKGGESKLGNAKTGLKIIKGMLWG